MIKVIHSKRLRFCLYLLSGTALIPVFLFVIANWLFPLPIEKLHQPGSTLVLDRHGQWLRAFTAPDDSWRIYEPFLDGISPKLREAVLTYEDRRFYYHFGMNPFSIAQAAIDNIKAGRIVRGGSTITMQVARMMEPKERTIRNKLIEMFRALQLEIRYSKDEILTLYFNIAPYGGNIVGSSAASRIYFNKTQNHLSLGEAALLAAIPNSPTRLRPDLHPESARKAREKVLRRMLKYKKINEVEFREAVNEPIPTKRHPMPFKAPHLTRLLVKAESSHAKMGRIHSTIDANIQVLSERILHTHLAPLRREGISTGAVVVLDTKSREVLAMVGSYDFFDRKGEGQVNGAIAPRSPGSTLKPFIYALALDRGLITPERLLHDVPVDYSGYRPVNYDGGYRGYVTAREALAHSLNVPAVNLYAQLGNDGIYSFLKRAGVSTLPESKEHYGLPLILGGCEVSLLELTTLYAGLANFGEFAPYQLIKKWGNGRKGDRKMGGRKISNGRGAAKWEKNSSQNFQTSRSPSSLNPPSKRILSKAACFILTEMLTEVRRPDLPTCFEASINLPKVAWKTGTSYGHRDAWSIGYTPEYTVGVWVGNFDGHGVSSLVGSEAAAPILFALFNALTTPSTNRWFTPPYDIDTREICALSGMPVSVHCPSSKVDFYIPGVASNEPCSIHKLITVDDQTRTVLCSHCRIGRQYQRVLFEEWPAEITTWLNRSGFAIPTIPPHNPDCSGVVAGRGPIIRSPAEDNEYHIRKGVPLEYQKIFLEASVSNRTKQIFWFLDGELIFGGNPTERIFLTPVVGKHTLTCVDDEGRSTNRTLIIKG
ncbi:penicillin-binding protein 1C [Candidatus Poribacteria bacterium]|nr:penicillin-binding protein 1C [Candidatus Poribacteria bacterium]